MKMNSNVFFIQTSFFEATMSSFHGTNFLKYVSHQYFLTFRTLETSLTSTLHKRTKSPPISIALSFLKTPSISLFEKVLNLHHHVILSHSPLPAKILHLLRFPKPRRKALYNDHPSKQYCISSLVWPMPPLLQNLSALQWPCNLSAVHLY